MYTFCGRFVYDSNSWFPQPFPPKSKTHLDESTPDPPGPLNSSLHTSFHFASFTGEADSWAFATTGKSKSRNATTAGTLIVINLFTRYWLIRVTWPIIPLRTSAI